MSNWKWEQNHEKRLHEERKVARQLCLDGDHEWVVDDAHYDADNRNFDLLLVCQRCIYLGQETPAVKLMVDIDTHNWDLIQEAHYEWKKEVSA